MEPIKTHETSKFNHLIVITLFSIVLLLSKMFMELLSFPRVFTLVFYSLVLNTNSPNSLFFFFLSIILPRALIFFQTFFRIIRHVVTQGQALSPARASVVLVAPPLMVWFQKRWRCSVGWESNWLRRILEGIIVFVVNEQEKKQIFGF